jgi:DNA (cytosine-5)-methyltransferase 1
MGELGYGFAYRVLDAQYFGVAQRRRRVFVVGYLGDWRAAAAVLFERHSLQGHPAPRREKGQRAAPCLAARTRGGGGLGTDAELDGALIAAYGGNNTAGPIDVATACNAHGGPHGRLDFASETFVAHALRGEGFDASEDGTGRGTPLVPVAHAFDARQSDVLQYGDRTGPLDTDGHSVAVAFSCKDHGADAASDVAPTLRAMGHAGSHANGGGQMAVACEIADTMSVGANQTTGFFGDIAAHGMQVRRLTPVECERLQGFPDGYTAIPWRGRSASECPDGPRYKALGNSMAVPVMRYLGERIVAVESER